MTRSVIQRALVFELAKVFGMALVVFTFFVLFFFVFKELSDSNLAPRHIWPLLPYLMPHVLRNAALGASLFATCFVYGRMAADNEVMALKAAGIHPLKLLTPALVLGLGCSAASVWLYDLGEGWGREGIYQTCVRYADQVGCEMLRKERSARFGRVTITVQDVAGSYLEQPVVWLDEAERAEPVCITAGSGSLKLNTDKLSLTLYETNFSAGSRVAGSWPDSMAFDVELPVERDIRIVTLPILAERQRLVDTLARLTFQAAMMPQSDPAHREMLSARLDMEVAKFRRLHTMFHHKLANSYCFLLFAMVGAALAVLLRTANFLSTFFLCFTPLMLLYNPLMVLGKRLAFSGAIPPGGVWICNLVVGLIGTWLVRRVVRH